MRLTDYPVADPQVAGTIVDEQAVIVLANDGNVNIFNSVATRIWELIDGQHSVGDIVRQIMDEYEVGADTALHDTCEFVQALADAHALVLHNSPVETTANEMPGGPL